MMEAASPTRSSRRAARRPLIVEESDDKTVNPELKHERPNPTTPRSPRKSLRRKNKDAYALQPHADENTRPSEISRPESPAPLVSTSKRQSPQKRNPTTPATFGRVSVSAEPSMLPTPRPSSTPEPSQSHGTPLADITGATVNAQTQPSAQRSEIEKVRPMDTVLEKPMDIVMRTRTHGAPQMPQTEFPKARMVIRHLVLTNFKSYAGRQEVGPFHTSFSSVVGPNGSGKSNVIDSLLFVFGFRASKMRQGKISALIHNSAKVPDPGFCEVEVHFEEVSDLPTGVPESVVDTTLMISRKAFKNNSSKYYINGKESNFTTVTSLLKDRGVDLDHKRFLILQGEVESIAQMKPKAANEHDDGLLEYLEDIIGTSKYKAPIEESAGEVETLNEVCVEKNSRVQHIEKERNNLEDKKNKALEYVRDENELTYKQSALYQVYLEECNGNLNVTNEAIEQSETQLRQEQAKHQGSEEDIKRLDKAYKIAKDDYDALEKNTQTILKDLAKVEREVVKFEEKRKFLTGKQKKHEKSLQTARLATSEAESLVQKHADDIVRMDDEMCSLEETMKIESKDLAAVRDSLKGKTQSFSDEIAAKQKQLEPWAEKISGKESAIAVLQSELDIFRERRSAGTVALKGIQDKIAGIEEMRRAKSKEVEDTKQQRSDLEGELKKVKAGLQEMLARESGMRSQVSAARQKADEARASLSNSQSQSNVLKGLMRLKESGRIEGFHGRLGSLGAIDNKYDTAISTACPSLENLVVDSVEVGQQCIDHLRKNNLGRANFILLDRLGRRDLSVPDTPEGAPRLFDLIKPKDDKFNPAFFSVLQNTLVVNDLEQANRIAYGARRWRVVTLDGQLIDVSGTMSGGGTRVARGGMSSKLVTDVTRDQVSKFETVRDALERDFQAFQDEIAALESRSKELTLKLPAFETRIQKMGLEIESCGQDLADAKQRADELAAQEHPSHSEDAHIQALEQKIATHEKELQKLHSQTSRIDSEIKTLQDKIMEVGGVHLRGQKAKVDGLKEQIDTVSEQSSNAEVSRSKATKDKAKHEKTYAQTEKDLAGLAHELGGLDEERQAHAHSVDQAKQKASAAQSTLEEKQEELAETKRDLEVKSTELNQIRGLEIEMKNQLEENHKTLEESRKRLRYWEDKLKKLALHSVKDFGEEENETSLPQYTKDELTDMAKDVLKAEIAALEEKTQSLQVDLHVLDEYRRRVDEYHARNSDLQTAVTARDNAKKRCDDLRRLRLEGFMQGFAAISLRLKEMYQMITMGGNAELELVDSLDPFAEGILFSVMPPKKSWKNISNLSGGEKTLSSLALVFALHHYKPTPLYVMDEIDAALDFRNVSIVAGYIKERTKNAQFIVISLRNNMFELASRLVGVYKVDHMTKSVTIENRDYLRM